MFSHPPPPKRLLTGYMTPHPYSAVRLRGEEWGGGGGGQGVGGASRPIMSPNGQHERRREEAARAPQTPFRSCARLAWFACEDSWKIHEHRVPCRLLFPPLGWRCWLTPLLAMWRTALKVDTFFHCFYHLILVWSEGGKTVWSEGGKTERLEKFLTQTHSSLLTTERWQHLQLQQLICCSSTLLQYHRQAAQTIFPLFFF